jgi:hypothetical protein
MENTMNQTIHERNFRVGFFNTVADAEQAVNGLLNAGFTKNQLAAVVPEQFVKEFHSNVPQAQRPGAHAAEAIVEGGAVGAALGGVALAATAAATGGGSLLLALPILVCGGALAGGFSGLILADGYGKEIGRYYEEATRLGQIVIGVKSDGPHSTQQLDEAERLLTAAGGSLPDS